MSALPAYVEPLGNGIFCIDTGFHRPRFDAAYLLVHDGRAAFIDTGTNFALPRLLGALNALGVERNAVDWVIPTHVHLDHAGGAGALMRELPEARMWVHPRGARHMIDPSALFQGAAGVYGEAEVRRSYGDLVGVDAARVVTSDDGMTITLGGRPLKAIDTPGHARHHHCIWDETSRGWFTGDTFGMAYPEFHHPTNGPWMLPTTTPVQFEPDALRASIARLVAAEPQNIFVTHYGRVQDIPARAAQLLSVLDQMVQIGEALRDAPDRDAGLRVGLAALHARCLRAHGLPADERAVGLLELDVELNAQGVAIWLDREEKKSAGERQHTP
jgi:glyoxylase-like metal-dependent hydrolase (beta-lactamase superfamily II)